MPTPARPTPKLAKKPVRRGGRWWKRLLVGLAVLGAVGLAGFTWFAYWPFEGRVDRVEALVPVDVDFLHRTSWRELKTSGWVQKNVFDDPVHPDLDPQKVVVSGPREPRQTLRDALARIPEQEAEINGQIPGRCTCCRGWCSGRRSSASRRTSSPARSSRRGGGAAAAARRKGPRGGARSCCSRGSRPR